MQFPQPDTVSTVLFFLSEKGCISKTQHKSYMSKSLSTISEFSQTKIEIAAKMLFLSFCKLKAKDQKQHWAIWQDQVQQFGSEGV